MSSLVERYDFTRSRIHISIPDLRLTFYLDGRVYGSYPCALGKPSTPTPAGNWSIQTKAVDPSWSVLGSRWMGLNVPTGNYGIHGTNAPWSIGRYISNGCIRMHNRDVESIFPLCPIGTPVQITGGYGGGGSGGGGGGGVLQHGSRGPEVVRLQQRLRELGYDPGAIDGIFGPQTESAVRRFQQARGLPADGVVGPGTRRELGI
ncbi:MAG: peptidoglycan-binding protein [Bacillota bacterium]